MPSFMHTLDRDDGPLEVEVTYGCLRASRGRRSSLGVPEEPDEVSGTEILSVKTAQGAEVELTADEYDDVIEAAEEEARDEIGSEDETPIWEGRDE